MSRQLTLIQTPMHCLLNMLMRPSVNALCARDRNMSQWIVLAWVAVALGTTAVQGQDTRDESAVTDQAASAPPPALRVVKLLWKAQPASAATALEKAIDQALSRRQVAALRPHLAPLVDRFKACLANRTDERWVVSVAALTLVEDTDGLQAIRDAVVGRDASVDGRAKEETKTLSIAKREFLLRVWLEADQKQALAYVQRQLAGAQRQEIDAAWLEFVALRGLQSDRSASASVLIALWSSLPKNVQAAVIEPLTQQAASMRQLVDAISNGKISKDLLNTNQLLKWSSGEDKELASAIERVWGKLRAADDAERKAVVARTLAMLRSGKKGDPVAGEQVFKRICSQCHRMHGEGIEVGPDISSNGRGSFEQLVSNVMDPSLVIGNAFQSKTVLTVDGRVLAGLVAAEDAKRLTLKIQGGKLVELDREEDIEELKESRNSLMPDGLEQQMKEQELVNLFAYLSLIKPLSAPENETIPGTPPRLLSE